MEIKDILDDDKKENLRITNKLSLRDKNILISGAAGSIGSSLTTFILDNFSPKKLILLDNSEYDIFNLQQTLLLKGCSSFEVELADVSCDLTIKKVFEKHNPSIVYHAAAYKHVPLLENFPYQAFKVNVLGTINMFENSLKYGSSEFVFISTDKAVNPSSTMGLTKRISEIYLSQYISNKKINVKVIRFGNIPNTRGSVLPSWLKQMNLTSKIKVVNKSVFRYFISLNRACLILTDLIGKNEFSLFVTDMSNSVNIYDLAIAFLKKNNKDKTSIIDIKKREGEKEEEVLYYENESLVKVNYQDNYFVGQLNINNKSIVLLEKLLKNINSIDSTTLKSEYFNITNHSS